MVNGYSGALLPARISTLNASAKQHWPFGVRPLTEKLGASIADVRLADGVPDDVFRAIYAAFLRYQVLLFPAQPLPEASQVAFARRFGEVQIHVMNRYHADGFPELYRLSNLDEHGQPTGNHPDKGTMAWHTDGSWSRVTGQATIIYGEIVPDTGGETHFCDMYGAYERLDDRWKARIATLRAVHNLDFSRTRRHGEDPLNDAQRLAKPPVDHPIVRTHPETGRKCLYLGDHAEFIVGLPYDEGREVIETLNATGCPPRPHVRAQVDAGRAHRLGQPLPDASGDAVRSVDAASRRAALHGARRRPGLGTTSWRRRDRLQAGRRSPRVRRARSLTPGRSVGIVALHA